MPRAAASSGLIEQSSSGRNSSDDQAERDHAEGGDQRNRGARDRERRAEHDRERRAGGVVVGGVEVEEQRGEPEAGAEHDARGDVAPARSLDAEHLHRRRGRDRDGGETPQRADRDQERSRTRRSCRCRQAPRRRKTARGCTVNTPTVPATTATTAPTLAAICTWELLKNPGAKIAASVALTR